MKKSITKIKNVCDMYKSLLAENEKAQKYIKKLMAMLEATYLEVGRPNWKYDTYNNALLRIVRPAANGNPRKFVYVGADSQKIADAFAAIDRQAQYARLADKLSDLVSQAHMLSGSIYTFEEQMFSRLKSIRSNTVPTDFMKETIDLTGGAEQLDLLKIRPVRKTG